MQSSVGSLDRAITDLVRKYLMEEKNNTKVKLREILEEHIEKFLSLVSDDDKFYFPETAFILLQSATSGKKFTAHGATVAWNAIFQYATNLMAQPWRKEFYTIRTFSGFYQHNVDNNLFEAWRLLGKIGYERIDNKLVLSPPLDPDELLLVARDALVAYMECQMIQGIWEGVQKRGAMYSWLQILDYRKYNICSVHSAVSALSADYRYRLHQSMHCHDHFDPRHIAMSQQPLYGRRYGVDCYGMAPYGNYVQAPMVQVPVAFCNMNQNMYAVPPTSVNVPTAQLIEVEPSPMAMGPMVPTHQQASIMGQTFIQHLPVQPVGSPLTPATRPLHSPSSSVPRMENGFVKPKSSIYATVDKTRNWDGGVQAHRSQSQTVQPPPEPQSDSSGLENWDYVYSRLENQGYNKDVGERGDLLKTSGGDGDRGLSNNLQRMQLDDRESSEVDGRASLYDNVPSSAKVRSPGKNEIEEGKWECSACTFHNKSEYKVCEMCSKSRKPGSEEQPLASGGTECLKCTLVNKKDAIKCDACGTELEGSPTYV